MEIWTIYNTSNGEETAFMHKKDAEKVLNRAINKFVEELIETDGYSVEEATEEAEGYIIMEPEDLQNFLDRVINNDVTLV